MSVELQLAPKRELERALETARSFGIIPPRVELAAGAEGGSALNLLPGEPVHGTRENRLRRALTIVAAAACGRPRWRSRCSASAPTVAKLQADVAAARAEAEESLAMRDRLEQLTRSAEFLEADKRRQPMVVRVLDELTRLVPDQAYITQLDIHDQTVEVQGFAATASDLIALLEQSPLFKAPEFRSPVTQDRRSGAERFHVSVELVAQEGG